jgi:hypothetical protein
MKQAHSLYTYLCRQSTERLLGAAYGILINRTCLCYKDSLLLILEILEKRNLEVNCALENDLANFRKKIDFFETLAEDPLTSSTQEISSCQLLF